MVPKVSPLFFCPLMPPSSPFLLGLTRRPPRNLLPPASDDTDFDCAKEDSFPQAQVIRASSNNQWGEEESQSEERVCSGEDGQGWDRSGEGRWISNLIAF